MKKLFFFVKGTNREDVQDCNNTRKTAAKIQKKEKGRHT